MIEWFCREILGFSEVDDVAYAALGAAAADAEPGCDGLSLSPHFDGRVTPAAPTCAARSSGSAILMAVPTSPGAVLESIAFEYRAYLDIVHDLQPDWRLNRVVGAGGGTHSQIWNQIKADALGAEYVPIVGVDPGTRGAALVAVAHWARPARLPAAQLGTAIHPDPGAGATYDRLHRDYVRWADHLAEGYRGRSELAHPSPTNGETSR